MDGRDGSEKEEIARQGSQGGVRGLLGQELGQEIHLIDTRGV